MTLRFYRVCEGTAYDPRTLMIDLAEVIAIQCGPSASKGTVFLRGGGTVHVDPDRSEAIGKAHLRYMTESANG